MGWTYYISGKVEQWLFGDIVDEASPRYFPHDLPSLAR
jgi:hypothetical protein